MSARWLRSSASAPVCPKPRLALHDPWALRALVMVMLVATFFAAGDERAMRLGAAFHLNGMLAPANVRVDAWVTPPLYTGKPPVILSAANKEAAALPASGPLAVPAGSTLIVRSSGGSLDVAVSGGLKEVAPTEAAPKGTNEKHFTISGDGTAHLRAPSGQPQWAFAATPDRAPTIALAKDPEAPGPWRTPAHLQGRGRLRRHRRRGANRPACRRRQRWCQGWQQGG
ncbi:hypothetical protein ACVWWO_005788 [Bradyrhizobium sp. F1.13.1]